MSLLDWFGLLLLIFAWHGFRWAWRLIGLALVRRKVLDDLRDIMDQVRGGA